MLRTESNYQMASLAWLIIIDGSQSLTAKRELIPR